ncbi:MAG: 50S ribosomal protein L6 [Patescibacteria group bacterium]
MSRTGKQKLEIPAKTEVTFVDGLFTVKGPKGELKREFKNSIAIKIDGSIITLEPVKKTLETNALWGTYASHIKNMIAGVNTPYIKKLILEGIGYKADVVGTTLKMALGFSHPVNVEIPAGITVTSEKGILTITGADKEAVGQFAAETRSLKKPEPYKGKGFRYEGEIIKRKQGKKTA